MPHPITRAVEIFPGRFDSQMRVALSEGWQSVSRSIALQEGFDQMPFEFGLGAAVEHVEATGTRETARLRLNANEAK